MKLDLGGQEEIDGPTVEQVEHYLRFMPAESPYIVLEEAEGVFIQAIIEEEAYRVEHRRDDQQWLVKTNYERACELFKCFMDPRCAVGREAQWKKLTALNTPWNTPVLVILIILIVSLTILGVLVEFGLL